MATVEIPLELKQHADAATLAMFAHLVATLNVPPDKELIVRNTLTGAFISGVFDWAARAPKPPTP